MARLTAVLLLVTLLWPVIPVRSGGDEAGTGAVVSGRVPDSRPSVVRQSRRAVSHARGVPAVDRLPTVRPTRPVVRVPQPPVIVVTRTPRSPRATGTNTRRGLASWFCGAGSPCTRGYAASGLYAAAGPGLRVGNWRGRSVLVSANGRQVRVVLSDWCACTSRLVDLYRSAFTRLANPSVGLVEVTVTW